MAIQSAEEWLKQNKKTTTPLVPTPQTTGGGGLLSKIGSFFGNNPVGKRIMDVLQGLEYPIGGYLSSTYKKSQELAPQVQTGQIGKPEATLRALGAGFGGIIPGIKNRTTIFDYLENVKELTPAQKIAIGLPASIAIPSVPIGKIAKVTGVSELVGKGLGAAGEIPVPKSRFGSKLGELLVSRYGQPEQYKILAKGAEQAINTATERGVEIAKPISKLAPDTQTLIGQIMKGERKMTPELEPIVRPAIEEFRKWGQEAVKEGLLDEKIFSKWGPLFEKLPENVAQPGYLPRLYRVFEKGGKEAEQFAQFKPSRLDLSRFMERQDIPEEIRKVMGEITEAGYPTAKGISQMAETVTKSKLYRKVAENTEWASNVPKEGFELLPTTERLGQLSGKYVLSPIAHDLQEMVRTKEPLEKVLNKITGWWKYGKVVANPATQVRNVMSNVVLADTVGGLSPSRVDIYMSALGDLSKRTGDYKEAKDLGLMGTTFYGNEIKQMLDGAESGKGIINFLKDKAKGLGNLYQAEEEWFKLALYKFQKELGKSPAEAAKIAQEALFDYSDVPTSIKAIRESVVGFPFATFTYKAMPALAKAFTENPTRFAQYSRLGQAIESLSSKEETQAERKAFPDYMKEISKQYLKLPIKDKYGRSQYFDLSYIYPWFSFGGIQPFRHPIIGATTDIMKNKDGLGNEIYKSTDTPQEAQVKIAKYVWQQMVPPLAPGGYSFGKLSKAIGQEKDYRGRVPSLPGTIFDVWLGLKTTPFDLREQKMWRQKESEKKLQDLKYEMRGLLRRPGTTPEEKEKARSNYRIKSQDILKQLRGK